MSGRLEQADELVEVGGLPKQFLSSLRILFDILDENRTGFVRLRDIESRWSDDGVRGLPPGVVDGLRKVTPLNGLLSFDRFVAGLKLVLIKKRGIDDTEPRRPFSTKENRNPVSGYHSGGQINPRFGSTNSNKVGQGLQLTNKPQNDFRNLQQHPRQNHTPSNYSKSTNYGHSSDPRYERQPVFDSQKSGAGSQYDKPYSQFGVKVDHAHYPNVMSMSKDPASNIVTGNRLSLTGGTKISHQQGQPPAVPPRTDRPPPRINYTQQMKKSMSGPDLQSYSPPAVPPRERQPNNRILNDLKNWQKEWSGSVSPDRSHSRSRFSQPQYSSQENAIYANIDQFQSRQKEQQSTPQKATVRRQGSGRRHTLANGIDQNMLKRMKQLEEETSILRAGLVMLEQARDWYKKQLTTVTDKQAMLGKVSYNDNSVEAHQERMNFQRARIAEVNQHLRSLIDSSEKGFPLHMNLALSAKSTAATGNDLLLVGVKDENRRLIGELNQKQEQMAQLEKEKASLVRELFEARCKNKSNYDDTTFM